MTKGIIQQLEEVTEEVCQNFCKYADTTNDECECEYMREHHKCVLDKINGYAAEYTDRDQKANVLRILGKFVQQKAEEDNIVSLGIERDGETKMQVPVDFVLRTIDELIAEQEAAR